jgi:hypothetical protein
LRRTLRRRPDLLEARGLSPREREILAELEREEDEATGSPPRPRSKRRASRGA